MTTTSLQTRLQQNLRSGTLLLEGPVGTTDTSFRGSLTIGGLSIPIAGSLVANNWRVQPRAEITVPLGVSDLLALVCDPLSLSFIPASEPFDSLALQDFSLDLGAGDPISAVLSYRLQSAKDWDVITDTLSVTNVGVSVFATRRSMAPRDGVSTTAPIDGFSARVYGKASIAGFDLDLMLDMNGSSVWVLEFGSEKNPLLPSLADLAAFAGIDDPSGELEESLELIGIEDFALTGIDIGFDRFKRKLSYIAVSGSALIGDVKVNLFTRVPDFFISGGLAPGNQIPLESLLPGDVELPDSFPNITFSDLQISYATKRKVFTFGGAVNTHWEIIPGTLSLDKVQTHLSVSRAAGKSTLKGGIGGSGTIADARVEVWAELQDVFTLGGGVAELKLSSLLATFLPGVALPPELPELTFEVFSFSVTPSTGAFSVDGACSIAWDLPFGVSGLAVSETTLHLSRGARTGTAPAAINCSIGINGTGPAEIVDGLTFNSFSLAFNLANQASWSLSGSVSARVFDTDYALAATLEETPALRKFSFSLALESATPLLSIPGAASLDVDRFAITVGKPLQAAQQTGGISRGGSAYVWSVGATGSIAVEGAFSVAGSLEIFNTATSSGFAFRSPNTTVEIPIPVPEHSIKTHLGLDYLSIARVTDAGQSSWAFEAAIAVWFTGLPETFQKILADRIAGRFRVDSTGAFVAIVRLTDLVEFTVPDMRFGSASVPIGVMAFDASNYSLRLGRNLTLSMDFGLGLPASLNTMFGTKDDGSAAVRFFNTYQPGDPSSVTRFRLGIDPQAGVNFILVTSPIGSGRIASEEDQPWLYIDWGEFGAIKLMVPVFNYSGFAFTAKGGFRQVPGKPLKVPLTPLKMLLDACHLDAISDAVPDGIPLKELTLVDDSNRFRFDDFIRELEDSGGFTIPQEIRDTLRLIESRLDALPDRFKSYLRIEIPEGFQFSFTIWTDGSVRGKAWVEGDIPIKLIYSTLGPLGLLFRGTELYSIAFGMFFSGSPLMLGIDARVDTFDLGTLALSTLLPLDKLPIAPDTRRLNNRLIVKDLFVLITYQVAIPVPVPLFFNELGIEYLGLEGFEFQTHWGFPKPSLDMEEAEELFTEFKRFFTEHDYLLDAGNEPEKLALQLEIGSNYIGLPKYLSGKTLGTRKALPPIHVFENLAHLLNALKTLSFNEVIQVIPLDRRAGGEKVEFGPLALSVDWLMTSPDEFRRVGFKEVKASPEAVDSFIAVLPPVAQENGGENGEGLIVFLRGTARIKNVASLDSVFGIAASGSLGFNTGFKVTGTIADFIAMELGGAVAINPEGSSVITQPDKTKPPQGVSTAAFQLVGHSHLTVLGNQVFKGDIQVIDDRFWLKGSLKLFPPDSPLDVSGDLEGWLNKSDLFLDGSVSTSLGGVPLTSARGTFSNDRIFVSGSWLGQTVSFDVRPDKDELVVRGKVVVSLPVNVDLGKVTTAVNVGGRRQTITLANNYRIDVNVNATLDVNVSKKGFVASVVGRFRLNNQDVSVSFKLDVAPADLAALGEEIEKRILAESLTVFQTAFKTALAWAEGIANRTIAWAADAYAETGQALQLVYKQSASQAASVLRSTGKTATDVSHVLKDGYKAGSEQATKILHAAGFAAQGAADALRGVYKASVDDVGEALHDLWKKKDKDVKSILKKAGYSTKEVEDFFEDLGDTLSDEDTWNPSKW